MAVAPRRGTRIARPELSQRLARSLARGHVLLQADPGAGKTVALEEALQLTAGAAAWIRCGDDDREPNRLLSDLVAALGGARPDLGQLFGEWLATPEPVVPTTVVRAIARELEGVLVERLVIVFDDAERLRGSEPALALIQELLDQPGDHFGVAIATRVELPLRITKLRASGALDVVGVGDLAFTAAEAAELYLAATEEAASPEWTDAVMRATEGWPLGVALYVLAPAQAVSARRTTQEMFAYLAEEAVEALEPEFAEQLAVASLPRELNPAVAEALELPRDFAERAHGRGLFLRPIGQAGGRYLFHPLFRSFLLDRLAAERDPASVRELRRSAAPAVIASGHLADGIKLLFDAEDWPAALAALSGPGLELARSSPELVSGWLDRLPATERSDPQALMLDGLLEAGRGRMRECVTPLLAAREGFARVGDVRHDWMVRSLVVDGLWSIGDFDRLIEHAEGFEDRSAEVAGPFRFVTAMNAAIALATRGDWEGSSALAAKVLEHPEGAALAPYDTARRAFGEIPNGTIEPVLDGMYSAAETLADDDPASLGPIYLAGAAQIEMEIGREEESFEAWRRAARFAESYGMRPYIGLFARVYGAVMHAEAGRIADAEANLAVVGPIRHAGWRGHVEPATRAIVALAQGRRDEALRQAAISREIAAPAPTNELMWSAEWLAPVLADAGAGERALEVIAETLTVVDERFPHPRGGFYRARLLALRAGVRDTLGDPGAVEDLAACWPVAGDAIPHVLRRHRHRVGSLLGRAVDSGGLSWRDAVDALARAEPGGGAIDALLRHPDPGARAAAIAPAVASSSPAALERIAELALDPEPSVRDAAQRALDRLRLEPPPLRIEVLGGFRARLGSWPIADRDWGRPMVSRLVRVLIAHDCEAVPEYVLFDELWPGRGEQQARRSLHVAVSAARAVLDPPGSESSAIESRARTYRLRLGDGSVDAYEFERAALDGLAVAPGPERVRMLDRALGTWAGEPLPEDRYEPWAAAFRDRMFDLYRSVHVALAEAAERTGDAMRAIRHGRQLVELDPLDEGARRRLMTLHARTGRRGEALRVYLELRRALVDDLGIEPDASTNALHARILAGDSV